MEIYHSRSDAGRSDVGRGGYIVWSLEVTRRYEDPPLSSPATFSIVLGSFLVEPRKICRPLLFSFGGAHKMELIENMKRKAFEHD